MAKKENTEISIGKLEKYCKENEKTTTLCSFDVAGESVEYAVKYRISLEDSIKFIGDVVKGCIDKSEMSVIEIARSFLINRGLMTYYANFRMPSDINKRYNYILCAEDIISNILDCIDEQQYKSILEAIDRSIAFEKDKMLCEQGIRINAVMEKLSNISEQMEGIFGGIDSEQTAKFISNIASADKIDAKTLAEVFTKQVAEKQ